MTSSAVLPVRPARMRAMACCRMMEDGRRTLRACPVNRCPVNR